MSEKQLTKDSIIKLLRGVRIKQDEVRDKTILMAPERTLALDNTGIAILELVDGHRTISEIVSTLAQQYDAPLQTIGNDVVAFVRDLINRGYLEVENG